MSDMGAWVVVVVDDQPCAGAMRDILQYPDR